ncbi:alpha/beta hydrolase [Mycobacterium sp. UM_Kg1]|uniref:alpha/beta hydrolase n=1 Tax=Mycobacterium sp. UM_Kg1 TaxID=1545691 RepID=UPI00061AFF31|nr:alpha/beta hydrolase [Mycobacterium sp. UM_Kg1]
MTAPEMIPSSPRLRSRLYPAPRRPRHGRHDGLPVEVVEESASVEGRLAWLAARATIRPALSVGSYLPGMPWPFGLLDVAAKAVLPVPGTVRAAIRLPRCKAQLVRAAGVLPADGTRRVVLYMHGGAFLTCGANTHGRLVTTLSEYADSPVLVVEYRMIPKHSIADAVDDCYDGYRWLRRQGYEPEQIVLAGDSAGGYLSLALALRLLDEDDDEVPAAIVTMSPLLEIAKEAKKAHPNIHTGAMFPPKAFDALVELVEAAARRDRVHGSDVFEPLHHVRPGLPRTLIHVSGSEVLLHDAQLGAKVLAAAGIPVELRIWPGQIHVFQIAAPFVPEATRSLRQIGEYIREATG